VLPCPISLSIVSRLPAVGTTIFTIMSRLAQECGAINLSQGFPTSAPRMCSSSASPTGCGGHNQYAPMAGVPALRAAIAAKVEALYGAAYDPEHEVTVTAGAPRRCSPRWRRWCIRATR
jgi:methionine aminotransferase